jgi:hypothetical protein
MDRSRSFVPGAGGVQEHRSERSKYPATGSERREWRVELQNKVIGTYILTLTWEQTWSVKEKASEALLEAAGVEALGVERETGIWTVAARAPLQVNEKSASSELIRIDSREVPEWAGKADDSTVLAYRYLRPGYKLTVAAQRFEHAKVLQALVDTAQLTTVVAEDGQAITTLALAVRNNGRQHLENFASTRSAPVVRVRGRPGGATERARGQVIVAARSRWL